MMTKGESGRSDCYVLRLSALLCPCFFFFSAMINHPIDSQTHFITIYLFSFTLLRFVASISRSRLFGIKRKAAGKWRNTHNISLTCEPARTPSLYLGNERRAFWSSILIKKHDVHLPGKPARGWHHFCLLLQVLFLGSNTDKSAKMMTMGESGRSCVMRCDFLLALPLFLHPKCVNHYW